VATPTNQSNQNQQKDKIASRCRADFLSRATYGIKNQREQAFSMYKIWVKNCIYSNSLLDQTVAPVKYLN
jgi:hypothetical protein